MSEKRLTVAVHISNRKTQLDHFISRCGPLRIGLTAIQNRKKELFRLTDPTPLLYHDEPILRDGEVVGHLYWKHSDIRVFPV